MKRNVVYQAVLAMVLALPSASGVFAEDNVIGGDKLTDEAMGVLEEFVADKGMDQFRANLKKPAV